jgi:hypothetical protein
MEPYFNTREEVTGIRVTKLGMMRWPAHVARKEEVRNAYIIILRKSEWKRRSVDWLIILKWTSELQDVRMWVKMEPSGELLRTR